MSGKALGVRSGALARYALAIVLTVALAGCKWDDARKGTLAPPATGTGSGSGTSGTGGSGTPVPTANVAPRITGSPVTTAKVSLPYAFQPKATDADGDKLAFQVRSKPDWTSFDSRTGRLAGTPPPGSTGTYTGVQIIVSDGTHTVELAPFSISVLEPAVGSAELVWEPPTTNEDGSPLTDLAGYVIRYGRSAGTLDQSVRIPNAGTTMYIVEPLNEGTWYFSLSAVNGAGDESRPTGYVTMSIG